MCESEKSGSNQEVPYQHPLGLLTKKDTEPTAPDISSAEQNAFYTAEDVQQSIQELCWGLSKKVSDGKFDCEAWIKQLESHLSISAGRLLYSSISNYIFDKSEEELATFGTNIDFVLHYTESKVLNNPQNMELKKTYKATLKFYDHSNLAIQQQKLVNKSRLDLDDEVENILSPKISEITKDMTSQLVGLIGIFTALSFIVFGGISSLENVFGALRETLDKQQTVLPLLIIADAWTLCMMNLLFGFMYFVIRITHLPKPINEKAENVVQRYPVVFLCNYALIAFLTLLGGLWFAECNGTGKAIFEWVVKEKNSTSVFVVCVALYIFVICLVGDKMYSLYKGKKTFLSSIFHRKDNS